ncbi:hypothetical protein M0G43_11350 [Subsaxibacter sp. CAU 1640]|uniref:hypothetical protein n=1 Tax=Subsaxibacter sp. CAU 1640 TaxID=2933271 RepID=UPI0020031C0D|nr:hypothetical protein [Subsaxibacter sp. CAU 1640]MCK7591172.1 hypothetical protein [Subsaxibacter sp. CAU 1640]
MKTQPIVLITMLPFMAIAQVDVQPNAPASATQRVLDNIAAYDKHFETTLVNDTKFYDSHPKIDINKPIKFSKTRIQKSKHVFKDETVELKKIKLKPLKEFKW